MRVRMSGHCGCSLVTTALLIRDRTRANPTDLASGPYRGGLDQSSRRISRDHRLLGIGRRSAFCSRTCRNGEGRCGTSVSRAPAWRLRREPLRCAAAYAHRGLPAVELHPDAVQEFQSPAFRSREHAAIRIRARAGHRMRGIFARPKAICRGALDLILRPLRADARARHIPLYLIVASPIIAIEATSWWNTVFANAPKTVDSRHIGCALASMSRWGSAGRRFGWRPGIVLAVVVTAAQHWPSDFAKTFPIQMVATQQERIIGSRLFTSDQWGDYILYKLWPRQKVFVDGRSDFYGEKIGERISVVDGSRLQMAGNCKEIWF